MIQKLAIVRKQVSEWNDHLDNDANSQTLNKSKQDIETETIKKNEKTSDDFEIVKKEDSLSKFQSIKNLAKANSFVVNETRGKQTQSFVKKDNKSVVDFESIPEVSLFNICLNYSF